MTKMLITGYTNADYSGDGKEFEVQINPSSLAWKGDIQYDSSKKQGNAYLERKYIRHNETSLSFKLTLDVTGVLPDFKEGSRLEDYLDTLYTVLYDMNAESHEPRYVLIAWGDITFEGRLSTISQDYTLFAPDGKPLRVTISLIFVSHTAGIITVRREGKCSLDLSRVIVLRAGESLAHWCSVIYKDPSYCLDVARFNGLNTFRNVKPGTSVMFPPLEVYGSKNR
ncbi:MAG: hypothetical protein LUD15_04520 [Bacteroides sp.]|nr:hypothetical protein [Bacteroides sp.]